MNVNYKEQFSSKLQKFKLLDEIQATRQYLSDQPPYSYSSSSPSVTSSCLKSSIASSSKTSSKESAKTPPKLQINELKQQQPSSDLVSSGIEMLEPLRSSNQFKSTLERQTVVDRISLFNKKSLSRAKSFSAGFDIQRQGFNKYKTFQKTGRRESFDPSKSMGTEYVDFRESLKLYRAKKTTNLDIVKLDIHNSKKQTTVPSKFTKTDKTPVPKPRTTKSISNTYQTNHNKMLSRKPSLSCTYKVTNHQKTNNSNPSYQSNLPTKFSSFRKIPDSLIASVLAPAPKSRSTLTRSKSSVAGGSRRYYRCREEQSEFSHYNVSVSHHQYITQTAASALHTFKIPDYADFKRNKLILEEINRTKQNKIESNVSSESTSSISKFFR